MKMKSYLVLILLFCLALLQGAFLPLNLVLLLVLIWAVIRPVKEGLLVAFLAGIFLDLSQGSLLGLSSFLFLISFFLVRWYSRRFDPTHPFFLVIFVFLTSTLYQLILKEPWLIRGVILSLLSLLARPLIRYYHQDFKKDKLKVCL